jgi:hypothetical protein
MENLTRVVAGEKVRQQVRHQGLRGALPLSFVEVTQLFYVLEYTTSFCWTITVCKIITVVMDDNVFNHHMGHITKMGHFSPILGISGQISPPRN